MPRVGWSDTVGLGNTSLCKDPCRRVQRELEEAALAASRQSPPHRAGGVDRGEIEKLFDAKLAPLTEM